jgi:hypothetical protein
MTVSRLAVTKLVIAMTALVIAACGGNADMASPLGPSASAGGASISGTITGAAVTATRTAADEGTFSLLDARTVTITVVGTGITTSADNQGQFTLTNVPAGTVTLNFTGPGSNATVTLTGVSEGDRVQISVTVNGNTARVDSEHHSKPDNNKREFQGRIISLDASAKTFQISGMTVKVTDSTIIRHGNRRFTFTDLKVGDHVQARGTREGTTLTAAEVKVEGEGDDDDDDDDRNEAEVEGVVSGSTGTCPAVTFMIGTRKVTTSSTTSFRDGTCADATANGAKIEVKGTRQTDGSILATRVELEQKAPTSTTVTLSGVVSDTTGTCPAVSFTVQSTKITVNNATTYTSTTCAVATANNANVKVTGVKQSDNSVVATTIALNP